MSTLHISLMDIVNALLALEPLSQGLHKCKTPIGVGGCRYVFGMFVLMKLCIFYFNKMPTHRVNLRLTIHAWSSAIETHSGTRTMHVKENASLPTLHVLLLKVMDH